VEDENDMLAGLSSSSGGGSSNSRSSNGARPFSTNTQVYVPLKNGLLLFLSFSCPVQPVCPFAALHADFAAACQCIQARAIHC